MFKQKIELIQELDEEQLLSSKKQSEQVQEEHTFRFKGTEQRSDEERSNDSLSNHSNYNRLIIQPDSQIDGETRGITDQVQGGMPLVTQIPQSNMGVPAKKRKWNVVDQRIYNEVINEDEEHQEREQGTANFANFKKRESDYGENIQGEAARIQRKEKIVVQVSQDRLDKYEELKKERKTIAFALMNPTRNQCISPLNYKSRISEYMKDQEKIQDLIQKEDSQKKDFQARMISTEIEKSIKDHVVNHKVRANQKYQVVKNFFRIWFTNTKEIRREEKKNSLKNPNQQAVTDKILNQKQQKRKKNKFLNEKESELITTKIKPSLSQNVAAGQLYVKPGPDIKLFIPFCTDIYLGKN